MVYSELENYYVDGEDQYIKKMMEDSYAQALTPNQTFWYEADLDTRFKAGDQQIWNELYGNIPSAFRKSFNFNRIRRIINVVTGYQRKYRKSIVTVPIGNSDNYTSDQLSKVLFWATKQNNVLETFSDAFEGSITTGMNLLSVWMDYRNDSVCGDICVDNVGYNGYLIDPFFRKHNLSDCNYLWRRMWRSKEQLKSLFPGREKEVENMTYHTNRDGKFNFMAESYNYNNKNLLALDEYWYLTTRSKRVVEDLETGDSVEYFGDEKTLRSFLAEKKSRIVKTIQTPTVRLVYCVNNRIFYNGVNPYGHKLYPIDVYPFIPVFAYYEPDLPYFASRLQGITRGLRDAQYLYNRRKVIELDILESQVNSGWIYEEDALIDGNDVFQTGQGKGIGVKSGRLGSVQRIEPAQVPASMMQLSETLGREIMEISGVNEELLGSAEGEVPGILSMLRQGAGLVTLQKIFDQADFSLKILGQVMVQMIQANFRSAKIARITEQEASPQFFDKAFQRFDIEVAEGLNTSTQRQMQFVEMLELYNAKVPIAPEDLIEAATIQNKSTIIENMQKREQEDAKQREVQMSMEMEVLRAQIDDLKSRALANQGLGIERASRVAENESLATQREAEAVENVSMARLNKIKGMKELQDMDLGQVQKLLEIVQMLSLQGEEAEVKAIDDSKTPSLVNSPLQTNDMMGQ